MNHVHTWVVPRRTAAFGCGYGTRTCIECGAEEKYEYGDHDWDAFDTPDPRFQTITAIQVCKRCSLRIEGDTREADATEWGDVNREVPDPF